MRLRFTILGVEVWALELDQHDYYPAALCHEGEHIVFTPED